MGKQLLQPNDYALKCWGWVGRSTKRDGSEDRDISPHSLEGPMLAATTEQKPQT